MAVPRPTLAALTVMPPALAVLFFGKTTTDLDGQEMAQVKSFEFNNAVNVRETEHNRVGDDETLVLEQSRRDNNTFTIVLYEKGSNSGELQLALGYTDDEADAGPPVATVSLAKKTIAIAQIGIWADDEATDSEQIYTITNLKPRGWTFGVDSGSGEIVHTITGVYESMSFIGQTVTL